MKSAYEILGVPKTASADEIDGAFRRHSKALHPDVNKRPTAAQEFKELKCAYDALRDPTSRSNHDYNLAVVSTKFLERDTVDEILDSYSIAVPKKKKKKKKKKQSEAKTYQQPFVQPQPVQPIPRHHYPNAGRGNGDFERIPGGYDSMDDLGGIL